MALPAVRLDGVAEGRAPRPAVGELDNPAWLALTGEQREFGMVGERAACYLPDVSPIAAVADQSTEALAELAGFIASGRFVALIDPGEPPPALWRLATVVPLTQWICPDPVTPDESNVDWIELGDEYAGEMYRLVKETDPGPFERCTHRLGDYVGVVHRGGVVAMAGERICIAAQGTGRGFREVSAVCTDPAYVGRGYAQALVREIARRQQRLSCVPFLHVRIGSPAEAQASRVYEKVGFVKRRQVDMSILVRL